MTIDQGLWWNDIALTARLIMLQMRYLTYLDALARERHFARAANVCHVTQPTLSAGIKQLEDTFGVLIVERGQRYQQLTAEGEQVLAWARRMLADYDSLVQSLHDSRTQLEGQLRLGVIPTALPIVRCLSTQFVEHYPHASLSIQSCTSDAIQQGIDDFGFDAGITYLDNEPLNRVRRYPLYRERYFLVGPPAVKLTHTDSIDWQAAASYRLCLLTQDMQNRRILDARFDEVGVKPAHRMETDSLTTLLSHVRYGGWYSILPGASLSLLTGGSPLSIVPLPTLITDPLIGLIASARDPLPPVTHALFSLAGERDWQQEIEPPTLTT
jgi:DNA-binding transcriptional LysR family regulator